MDARLELVLAAAIIVFAVLMSVRAVRGARDEDVTDISGPYDEKIRLISEVPRPRPIRMTFKAKFLAFVAFPGPLVLFALIAKNEHQHATPGITIGRMLIFFGLLEVLLVGPIWLRPFIRHKSLISEGDLAIGRILKMLSNRGYPYALYEFETASGRRIRKLDMTCRSDLSPGMKVPVFYNRENPKRAVALCTSFYDLVLPLKQ